MNRKENENSKSLLGSLRYVGAFLEKLRIVQRMQGAYSIREIEYLTGLTESQVDRSDEELDQVISKIERGIEANFWDDRLTKLFLKIGERSDDDRIGNGLRKIFVDTMEMAKRETRLQIAYNMLLLKIRTNSIVFFDGIARITNLSIEDMECLADISRIRTQQKRRTQARVVERALQAQIDRPTIAKIVGVYVSELDDLLTAKDNEEDTLDFSCFMFKNISVSYR